MSWLTKLLPLPKPDPIETLTSAIKELSGLIRLDLQQRGVSTSRVPRISPASVRKRTANDVRIFTRQDEEAIQLKETIEQELEFQRPESNPVSPNTAAGSTLPMP